VRRSFPRALAVVLLLVAILGFYFVLLGVRGLSLLGDPRWVVKGLGLGILLLPVVGIAIVAQELRFGRSAQRLGEQLDREQLEGNGDTAGPTDFDTRREAVRAAPDDWRAWYRLGVAYGDAGDVARGRRAVRKAIALERRSSPNAEN